MSLGNNCALAGFLDDYDYPAFLDVDRAHLAGEHETPEPSCPRCALETEPKQLTLEVA